MNYQRAWESKTQRSRPRRPPKKGWHPPGFHDPWEYNTTPLADREWMRTESPQDRTALSRSITGGSDPKED